MKLNDCNTEEKAVNRDLIKNYAIANLRRKPKDWVVACLPGPKLLEVLQIWRNCGVLKRNIYGFSNNDAELKLFRKHGINQIRHDLLSDNHVDVLFKIGGPKNARCKKGKNKLKVFDVIYFDMYANFAFKNINALLLFFKIGLKDNGVCGYTFYGARETEKAFRDAFAETSIYFKSRLRSDILALGLILTMNRKQFGRKVCTSLFKSKYVANGNPMYTVIGKFRSGNHYINSRMPYTKIAKMASQDAFTTIGRDVDGELLKRGKRKLARLERQSSELREEADELETQAAKLLKVYKKECKDEILYYLSEGVPTKEIADAYNFPVQKVAAYKAHMTMGTYN